MRRLQLMVIGITGVALIVISNKNSAGDGPEPKMAAHWIWVDETRKPDGWFRKEFKVGLNVKQAWLRAIGDFNETTIFLNGKEIASVEPFSSMQKQDVSSHLKPGSNILAIQGKNGSGPAAVAVQVEMVLKDGMRRSVVSDASWLASTSAKPGWEKPDFQPRGWHQAISFGKVAPEFRGDSATGLSEVDDYHQWKQALNAGPGSSTFQTMKSFQIELLRPARKDEGSWISMAFDPQGRVLIGKEDKGILRLTLPKKPKSAIQVETINDTLKECRGLLCAFGNLYVNANQSKGLFRLRDTNGDDRFDEVKLLYASSGGGGHGRNDLTLGPDNKIYAIHGDAVDLPKGFIYHTSPFREQSRGIKTKQGHVIRTDKDGKTWELVASGLRNPYGIDFHPDGEMFTYDADAEYDSGSPWYRPTRVNHILPGGDFGWRGVTRSWPPYYPDQPDAAPPTIDIGRGSPTSVKFGTKSNFPPKYKRALFALDWAYGRVVAVHLTPRGASYTGRAETILKGRPLNVTDLDFGPDGHMYLVTGGRKTQSGLYRVRYVGAHEKEQPPTAQQAARMKHAARARGLRQRLQSFHAMKTGRAIEIAWPYLDNPDPTIRHAARIAIEHQPVSTWQSRALNETRPTAVLTGLLALVQGCDAESLPRVLTRVNDLRWDRLSESRKLMALRIYALYMQRSKKLEEAATRQIIQKLATEYPSSSVRLNQELSLLLEKLGHQDMVPKTLSLLARANNQKEELQYLFVLRDMKQGWSPGDRKTYFRGLSEMSGYRGGEGMPTFVQRVRADALASLTKAERSQLEPLLKEPKAPVDLPPVPPRPFVREWQAAELAGELGLVGKGRDFDRGKAMFTAASCIRCHQMGSEGYTVGPDLTTVASRFSRRDLLESIISPSKVVSDKYRTDMVVTSDGRVLVGRIVPGSDYRSSELSVSTNPLDPRLTVKVHKSKIESYFKRPISVMPQGLLNSLSKAEILDLMAFIEAGGKKNHPNFK